VVSAKKGNKGSLSFPLSGESVSAGFPSPAEDYLENSINLNEYLINHPYSTFFLRVSGDSMSNANINHGDLLIVDRSINPKPNNIVIALLDGDFILKRLIKKDNELYLKAENYNYSAIPLSSYNEVQIWGVAIYVIHKL
tara:strand:+ start:1572 stop:1988 length:417 start_codon:yes stop_codon:yes gene_type:complete